MGCRLFVHCTAVVVLCSIAAVGQAEDKSMELRLKVSAGEFARKQTPVRYPVRVPAGWADQAEARLTTADGTALPVQLARPSLLNPPGIATTDKVDLTVWTILPELPAGESVELKLTIAPGASKTSGTKGFHWKDTTGQHLDLEYDSRPVARYMYQKYKDEPELRDLNNKPFHHLFDPQGDRLVTKGSGGEYTHHQGLYYGFTRCTFEGGVANTWYCHHGDHQLHKAELERTEGPILGRHRTSIDWNDTKGETFCHEIRELAAFAVNGGTLVEWSSQLSSVRGTVTLDGDAQHAGFQFRAANEVAAKTKSQTTYLRPAGPGKPGETVNPTRGQEKPDTTDAATKAVMNLPWKAMTFVLGDQKYSVAYLDSPRNPKPSFYSERDYGRFGSWFGPKTLKEGEAPLEIRYRVWLQQGEITSDAVQQLAADLASPPTVEAIKAN